MVILKIHEKGHYIELPGISPVNTPVEIDITRLSLPLIIAKLTSLDIKKWEIVSESKTGHSTVYKREDFLKKVEVKESDYSKLIKMLDKRFRSLDDYMKRVDQLERQIQEKDKSSLEQNDVTNSLKNIEKLIKGLQPTQIVIDEVKKSEDDIYDDEIFVPSISGDSMQVSGKASVDKHVKDDDLDDTADMLSKLSKNGGSKK